MNALAATARRMVSPAWRRKVGTEREWALRGALMGATFAATPNLLALALDLNLPALFAIVSTLAGALLGLMLGAAVPLALHLVRSVRFLKLLALGCVGGGVWGAMAGALAMTASLVMGAFPGTNGVGFAVPDLGLWLIGATAMSGFVGAAQVGWTWLPALRLRARGRRLWPIWVGSILFSPVITTVAFWGAVLVVASTAGVMNIGR